MPPVATDSLSVRLPAPGGPHAATAATAAASPSNANRDTVVKRFIITMHPWLRDGERLF